MKKQYSSLVIGLLLVTSLSLACRRGSAESKQFCSLPFEEREKAFLSYPVGQQYSLYLIVDNEPACDMDSESLSHYLAWDIAEGDEKTADFLAEKLREEQDEDTQRSIIYVLRAMSTKGKLRGRKDIAELVKQKVSSMRGNLIDRMLDDDYAVKTAREFSKEIEANTL